MFKVNRIYLIFSHIVLMLVALSMLLPFLFMFVLSVSGEEQIMAVPYKFIPDKVILDNYLTILKEVDIGRYFLNSFIVASLTTIGQVIISAFAGYAFARFEFRFKEPLFIAVLLTMMTPPQVNIIPLFFLMRSFHWIDTYQALILPGLFGGFGVFMMRQWFKMLPKELEEASKIDGCSRLKTFLKISFPLALPAVITLGIFTFITTWNSFMWPLIVTTSDAMRTLPIGLAQLKSGYKEIIMWGEMCAYCIICALPVIVIFLFGKKYFINDIMQGGLKE